jgi:hypothetical protein
LARAKRRDHGVACLRWANRLQLTRDHDDERHLFCPGFVDHFSRPQLPSRPLPRDPSELSRGHRRKQLIEARFGVQRSQWKGLRHVFNSIFEPLDMRTSSAAVMLKAAAHPLRDDRLELGCSLLPDAVASLENIQARIG